MNDAFMTYTDLGKENDEFAVWDRKIILPMDGKVVTRVEKEIDNPPNLAAAIDLEDHEDGKDVALEEKPQNLVEIKPLKGQKSPFLLRMIHLRKNSIPADITVE